MEEKRIYDMDVVKQEDKETAKKTPFYQTESTGGSVWVIKPGQTLQKHRHHNSDDIWIVLQGEGIFYPEPDKEIPLKKGQVIVSPKGACHGAMNTGTEDIVFVSIVAPVPADYDPIDEWNTFFINVFWKIPVCMKYYESSIVGIEGNQIELNDLPKTEGDTTKLWCNGIRKTIWTYRSV